MLERDAPVPFPISLELLQLLLICRGQLRELIFPLLLRHHPSSAGAICCLRSLNGGRLRRPNAPWALHRCRQPACCRDSPPRRAALHTPPSILGCSKAWARGCRVSLALLPPRSRQNERRTG